jgi:hypothetical protein
MRRTLSLYVHPHRHGQIPTLRDDVERWAQLTADLFSPPTAHEIAARAEALSAAGPVQVWFTGDGLTLARFQGRIEGMFSGILTTPDDGGPVPA